MPGFTEEMRQKAIATRQRNARIRREGGVGLLDKPAESTTQSAPLDGELLQSEDSVAAQLKRLALALAGAADDQIESNKALGEIEDLLGTLRPKDFPALAASPQVQAFVEMLGATVADRNPSLPPGTIINQGTLAAQKIPWTHQHVLAMVRSGEMPMVRFTPTATVELGWNNLVVVARADEEVELPKCFYDVYMESRRLIKAGRQHADVLFKRANSVDPDVADVLGQGTARVRAMHQGDKSGYMPGAGFFTPGLDEGEAEGDGGAA